MTVTIWHNPRCSKSRETLALLEDQGIVPVVRGYLEDAPSEDENRTQQEIKCDLLSRYRCSHNQCDQRHDDKSIGCTGSRPPR